MSSNKNNNKFNNNNVNVNTNRLLNETEILNNKIAQYKKNFSMSENIHFIILLINNNNNKFY